MITIFLAAAAGAAVPSILRLLHWSRSTASLGPINGVAMTIGLALQVLLGLLACWLLAPSMPLHAAAFGYAAPELLTRLFASIAANPPGNTKGLGGPNDGGAVAAFKTWASL